MVCHNHPWESLPLWPSATLVLHSRNEQIKDNSRGKFYFSELKKNVTSDSGPPIRALHLDHHTQKSGPWETGMLSSCVAWYHCILIWNDISNYQAGWRKQLCHSPVNLCSFTKSSLISLPSLQEQCNWKADFFWGLSTHWELASQTHPISWMEIRRIPTLTSIGCAKLRLMWSSPSRFKQR